MDSKLVSGVAAMSILAVGSAATAAEFTIGGIGESAIYDVFDTRPTGGSFDNIGDGAIDRTDRGVPGAAQQFFPGINGQDFTRSVLFFDISSIPETERVVSAELTLRINGSQGSFGFFNDLLLFHSSTATDPGAANAAAAALYGNGTSEGASFTDTGEIVFEQGVTTVPSNLGPFEVTEDVAKDVDATGDNVVAFRLQNAGAFFGASATTIRANFDSNGNGGPTANVFPILTITTEPIPEPLTVTGGMCLLGAVVMRRRRV